MKSSLAFILLIVLLVSAGRISAQVCNLKIVTDASPDYTDMRSMLHSITDRWPSEEEKSRALFYWNHIARRQTSPMILHGLELTDPIRQFNDYGYTMCSTISGINCGIWHNLGLPVKFWDITNHTVSEAFFDGRWHMVDNSMSALYTLCDGKTLASVEEIGAEGACPASHGKRERGHIAKYHCLSATSPNGFLTGADTQRSLEEESLCFNPNALKYRPYYNNWDWGHRYILNLKAGESYTRYYKSLGETAAYYVPNGGKDPEQVNTRYHLRGNGLWHFMAELSPSAYRRAIHSAQNISAVSPAGLQPATAGAPAEVIFKVQGANVITSQNIRAAFLRKSRSVNARILISSDNGLHWREVWKADATGRVAADVRLGDEVNGAYEVLVKVSMAAKTPDDVRLTSLEIDTFTMLNTKTQPRLNLGRNTIYVGAGEQTESLVYWPELQGGRYRTGIAAEQNIASTASHPGYMGTVYPARAGEDAFLVYRMDAPTDITRLTYGGRFYNRAPKSRVQMFYSLDGGKTWTRSWILSSTKMPWDVIHYETVPMPKGHRSVWIKYQMNTSDPQPSGCSIYALRMEAAHRPADPVFRPLRVTFHWSERQADRTLIPRSHTRTITKLPARYTVDVGGADHPEMNWLRVSAADGGPEAKEGYSDGRDVGGRKFVSRWVTYGRNLAVGKPYTLSVPSGTNWEAGDPDGKKLTDGVVGPPCGGGITYRYGAIWEPNTNPVLTLDLGAPASCASFGLNVNGYPLWDALKGEVEDRIEVFTSLDGKDYTSRGHLKTDLRWKDFPANSIWPDDEAITAATFRLVPDSPVTARYVRFRVTSKRHFDCTEIEVLASLKSDPYDLRIALPDEWISAEPKPPAREIRDPQNETGASAPVSGAKQPARPANSQAARPLGEPVLEAPTLRSLGVYWIVQGDDNKNAAVGLEVRKAGTAAWKQTLPLFRVEKGANRLERGESRVKVPTDAWLFAGSVVLLDPGTDYELRLRLSDPDGGTAERLLKSRTAIEPVAPRNAPQYHVVPGTGGGSGTREDPYRGLAAAREKAKPGSLFLLHAGVYKGTFAVEKSGETGRPIIWRGAGDGEAVLDGEGTEGRVVDASGVHDVWFERLAIRNAEWGLVAHDSARIVIRRCHFTRVKNGITATRNTDGRLAGFFITDNLLEGPFSFPSAEKGAGVEENRGIQISGTGQVVCYNRIRRFKDGIDTFPSPVCAAIDIHNNEVSECLDDGGEMDGSERNNRLFLNRFTDVFQGISVQPVHGGPVYIFRNVVYNIDVEPYKMHNSPSGALFFHNTCVKKGGPFVLYTSAPVGHCVLRNNLFIGTEGGYASECDAPMGDCDFDYDGFGGGPWQQFLKWHGLRFSTLEETRAKAPVYRHAVLVDAATVFASGIRPPETWARRHDPLAMDLRLRPGTEALDTGQRLPGFNDDYRGKAPDLGAYEFGASLPQYGPRPEPAP